MQHHQKKSSHISRTGLVFAVLLVLTGCSGWWGEKEAPPLPGDRLKVLSLERSLTVSPRIADLQIRLPAPEPMADWPQAGGLASHALHHVALGAPSPRVAWSRSVGVGSASDQALLLAQPVIAQGQVFTVDSQATVLALDAENGRDIWKTELRPDDEEGSVLGGGLAFEGGRVFVATGFAEVAALEADTGDVIWQSRVSAPMRSAPTVRDGRVFAITVDNQTFALDAKTGETLWTHKGIIGQSAFLGAASPAVDGDMVLTAYSSGELVALRVQTGREIWSDTLTSVRRTDAVSAISDIRGRPVIDRDMVIATSNAGLTVGIDRRSGSRIWEVDAGGIHGPWVAGDFVYILLNTNDVVALRRRTGEVRWITPLPRFENEADRTEPIQWVGPALAEDRLIVAASTGEVRSVSPYTGAMLGRIDVSDSISLPPSIAAETLYFLTDDADLLALR